MQVGARLRADSSQSALHALMSSDQRDNLPTYGLASPQAICIGPPHDLRLDFLKQNFLSPSFRSNLSAILQGKIYQGFRHEIYIRLFASERTASCNGASPGPRVRIAHHGSEENTMSLDSALDHGGAALSETTL